MHVTVVPLYHCISQSYRGGENHAFEHHVNEITVREQTKSSKVHREVIFDNFFILLQFMEENGVASFVLKIPGFPLNIGEKVNVCAARMVVLLIYNILGTL